MIINLKIIIYLISISFILTLLSCIGNNQKAAILEPITSVTPHSIVAPKATANNIMSTMDTLTGRFTTYLAAADAPTSEKLQAHVVCNGKDDQLTIQKVIDSLPDGSIIHFSNGNYEINSQLNIFGSDSSKTDITLIGNGWGTSLNIPNEAKQNLIANTSIGDRTIYIADTSAFRVGMDIGVSDTDGWESWKIKSLDKSSITLSGALSYSYSTIRNACVINISRLIYANHHRAKFTIRDMVLNANASGQTSYWETVGWSHGNPNDYYRGIIFANHAANIEISGVWFKDIYFNAYLATPDCPNALVHNNYFTCSRNTFQSRSIASEGGCQGSVFSENTFRYTATTDISSDVVYLREKNQTCVNNVFYGGGGAACIRISQYKGCILDRNRFFAPHGRAIRVSDGASEYVISNNSVYNAGKDAILVEGGGVTYGNEINGGTNGIKIFKGDSYVHDNTITSTIENGIILYSCNNSVVENNLIKEPGIYGIYFDYLGSAITGVTIKNNTITGNANMPSIIGIYERKASGHFGNNGNFIIGNSIINCITPIKTIPDDGTVVPATVVKDNIGYIAPGEIRTISGTISGGTAGTVTSVDNSFGQAVRVLSVDLEFTTQSIIGGKLDIGIGSSAYEDYQTIFLDLPCDPGTSYPYHYESTTTPIYGKQTIPIDWSSGSDNRYLNFYNASTNSGLNATYEVTITGN